MGPDPGAGPSGSPAGGGPAGDRSWRLLSGTFEGKRKTEEELRGLQRRTSQVFRRQQAQGIYDYYVQRNGIIDQFSEVDNLLTDRMLTEEEEALDEAARREEERKERWAMRLSFFSNCVLLGLKAFIAVLSGSLAIITSALDSFLDLISGVILFVTARAMSRQDVYKFPIGKQRMEPLGVIAFSCIMGTVGFSVLIEAIRQLVGKEHIHHLEDLMGLVVIMSVVIMVKLFLWLYCRNSKAYVVRVYAQDHFNDVLTNAVGLAGALLGDRVAFWLDPLAAVLLAAYITKNWASTAYENIMSLVGMSAEPSYLQKLTYMCYNHDAAILQVDTVRAYTFGKKLFAEVDVILPPTMPLREAHDIGESLQEKLESLPEVERAFVHLDYEAVHRPEHTPNRAPSGSRRSRALGPPP